MRTLQVVLAGLLSMMFMVTATPAQTRRGAAPPPQPAQQVRMPQGNVEHGRYLAEHVAMCVECHSERDSSGNIIESQKFVGGNIPFLPPDGWATRVPRNRGLPGYTDEMAMRLLTQGAIGRDGKQLKPPMPRFRMTPQDAADVIAYLRSL
ncbi:MAG TPA: c-type cytochrome [Vicinamibacterales bacterium]|nr:c-type cytochrome [Vicinamibacterales bacterium]